MKFLALSSAAAVALTIGSQASADTIACGQEYIVKSGDFLSAIAQDAYGDPQSYTLIYSANADVIGSNPGNIRIGQKLFVPCLDAAPTASTANESAIQREATTAALPVPDQAVIRFVTATGWAPYNDEDDPQGGMLTEIANVAMAQADGSPEYKIDFINDWGSHLQPLISDHAYDFGLTWFRPNCDIVERLGDGSKFRCNNLMWSEPMFEQIFSYYNPNSDAPIQSHEELFGKVICRPTGYSMFMMEEHELVEPNITLEQPDTVNACFEGLANGTYDAVGISVDIAEGAISELGLQDAFRDNNNLSQALSLHAVISNTHPRAEEYLAIFDSGILKIKDSGEWFQIVRRHLTAHREKTQG